MMVRVNVAPDVLGWAVRRSRIDEDTLVRRFPKVGAWATGEASPTLRQLENFARATHTPIGYLMLPAPPVEDVPIPDFRTLRDRHIPQPSADLLDTVHTCLRRQDWFRTFAQINRENPVAFVGSVESDEHPNAAARRMSQVLGFGRESRGASFTEALRRLAAAAEDLGVLVMTNGVVGSNTHRKLDPAEFRGFALADPLAPLVFVNGADTKAAQIFTLVHELAHLWRGESALSDADLGGRSRVDGERWCNQVAAEFLLPTAALIEIFDSGADLTDELDRIAELYKVSTLVVLRRLHDAEYLDWARYREEYECELGRVMDLVRSRSSGGGNFYSTELVRVGRRFARALVADTLEGRTLYTEAFGLLGLKKQSTFDELAARLGYGAA